MGLIAQDWTENINSHLQSLGAKIYGQRWIYSLIRKLWDTTWDIWNSRHHTQHTTDGPTTKKESPTTIIKELQDFPKYATSYLKQTSTPYSISMFYNAYYV